MPSKLISVPTSSHKYLVRGGSSGSQNFMSSDFRALVFESWKTKSDRVACHDHTKKKLRMGFFKTFFSFFWVHFTIFLIFSDRP